MHIVCESSCFVSSFKFYTDFDVLQDILSVDYFFAEMHEYGQLIVAKQLNMALNRFHRRIDREGSPHW